MLQHSIPGPREFGVSRKLFYWPTLPLCSWLEGVAGTFQGGHVMSKQTNDRDNREMNEQRGQGSQTNQGQQGGRTQDEQTTRNQGGSSGQSGGSERGGSQQSGSHGQQNRTRDQD